MSAKDVRWGVEHNGASSRCLIKILEPLGLRVVIIGCRLSRLKTRIQIAEKKNQPTTTLESKKEELLDELDRYSGLLNYCAEEIRVVTGIPSSKLVEVATSTAFTKGEDRDHIYAELRKLDERGVTAELWKALLSLDQDALASLKLLPSSESSSPATETEFVQATGAHETTGTRVKATKPKRPRMPKQKVEEHWREVMNSGNRDLIQEYLTLGEIELAKKIRTSRGTLRECECFKNRKDELRKFNREHGAPKRR